MDTGPYLGTVAVGAFVPYADPAMHLLALDLHERGARLRALWGGRHPGHIPSWVAVTDLRTEHRSPGGGGHGSDGGMWLSADLTPGLPADARALRVTVLPPAHLGMPGTWSPGAAPPPSQAEWGGPVEVDLTSRPSLRTVPAVLDPRRPVTRSPLMLDVSGRPRMPALARPLRVIAVSSRLDAGRSGDPAVTSIEVGDDWFELHLTYNSRQSCGPIIGTGWNAVDDLGGEYHGSPSSGGGSGNRQQLDFVFVPALDPRATRLTVTVPDVVNVPHTGTGALTATLDLGPSPCPADG